MRSELATALFVLLVLPVGLATGGARAEDTQIIVMDVKSSLDDVPRSTLQTFTDIVASHIAGAKGYQPVTTADLSALLNLEAQSRDLLGCDEGACLGEFAGALGAKLVIFGRYEVTGGDHLINLRIVEIETSMTVASRQRVDANPGNFVFELPLVVDELLSDFEGAVVRGDTSRAFYEPSKDLGRASAAALVVGAAAGAGALGGGMLFAQLGEEPEGIIVRHLLIVPASATLGAAAASPFFHDGVGLGVSTLGAGMGAALGAIVLISADDDGAPLLAAILTSAGAAAFVAGYAAYLGVVPVDDTFVFGE